MDLHKYGRGHLAEEGAGHGHNQRHHPDPPAAQSFPPTPCLVAVPWEGLSSYFLTP